MKPLATLLLALFLTAPAFAQDAEVVPAPEVRASPLMMTQATLEDGTYLKLTYGAPRMRGREIFGGLVPYDAVWRLGANEATELTVTQDVTVAGQPLDAGTYAVFAIPQEDQWTLIFNEGLGQWGAYSYDEAQDVLRVEVPVQQNDQRHEAFTVAFEEQDEPGSQIPLQMMWDDVLVSVPVAAQ